MAGPMITAVSPGIRKLHHQHMLLRIPFVNIVCQIQVFIRFVCNQYLPTINFCLALSVPVSTASTLSLSVTSSLSTEFATGNSTNSNHSSAGMIPLPQVRRSNCNIKKKQINISSLSTNYCLVSHTPPPSRSNHLCVNGKRKCEHPSKKSTIDPSIFLQSSNVNSSRNNNDSQLYDGETTPRRGSCGSDSEPRVPSGKNFLTLCFH